MKQLKNSESGFTVIEFLVLVLILLTVGFLGLTSLRANRAENRDNTRKSDINALDFQLEAFYEKNNYYPSVVDATTLAGVDENSLNDPFNKKVGETGSQYVYQPYSCAQTKCKSFKLSSDLEREDVYIKESLNR